MILVKLIIKFYQLFISCFTHPSCRYYPTCSNYVIEAYSKHKILFATYISLKRLFSCNPWFYKNKIIDEVPKNNKG